MSSTELLFDSIKKNDIERVKQSLELSDCDLKKGDDKGRTCLHLAVFSNNIELIKLILEKGININIKSIGEEETPLHLAAFGSNIETLDFLLSEGADLECKDIKGWTPLTVAIITKNFENTKYFLEKKANPLITTYEEQRSLLHFAIRIQEENISIKFIHLLLSHEPKLAELQDKEGKTALHYAIKYRRDDLFINIFKYNVNCYHIKDFKGLSPLQFSNSLNYDDISQILEKEYEKYSSLHDMIDIYVNPLKRKIQVLENELETITKKK